MIICKNTKETLEQFKQRLFEEIESGRLSAEDAYDAFEEAYQKEFCGEAEFLVIKTPRFAYLFATEEQAVQILGDEEHNCFRSILSKYNITPKWTKFKKEDIENYNNELDFIDNICLAYGYLNFTNA